MQLCQKPREPNILPLLITSYFDNNSDMPVDVVVQTSHVIQRFNLDTERGSLEGTDITQLQTRLSKAIASRVVGTTDQEPSSGIISFGQLIMAKGGDSYLDIFKTYHLIIGIPSSKKLQMTTLF